MKEQVTPLRRINNGRNVWTADGHLWATAETDDRADYIVRAVNSHEALVNALEAVSRLACLEEYSAIYKQVQSALALAKGKV